MSASHTAFTLKKLENTEIIYIYAEKNRFLVRYDTKLQNHSLHIPQTLVLEPQLETAILHISFW
jgi:RNase adaptor protein for sRNA GlmZ degradation